MVSGHMDLEGAAPSIYCDWETERHYLGFWQANEFKANPRFKNKAIGTYVIPGGLDGIADAVFYPREIREMIMSMILPEGILVVDQKTNLVFSATYRGKWLEVGRL